MTKPAPSLFALLMGHALRALAVFAVVFLLVFGLGFWMSRDRWQDDASRRIHERLGTELDHLVGQGGALDGEAVNRVLRSVLEPTVYIMVFQPDGTLIFWSWRGQVWYEEDSPEEAALAAEAEGDLVRLLPDTDHPGAGGSLYSQLQAEGKLTSLVDHGTVVGAYASGHHAFELMEENLQFLFSLAWALGGGLAAAAVLTAVFAWRSFRRSSRQAGLVQAGLRDIAAGAREVSFPPAGSRELDAIAGSALELQASLVREQDLRRRWAQDIAHDLMTPLAGLRVQLDGLADGVLDPSPHRIRLLKDEVGRLEGLTSDLLVLSRLESPELRLDRRLCRLSEVTDPLFEHVASLASKEGREWDWSVFDGEASFDPDLMHRALANLLSNALNHCSGPGPLEAEFSADAWGLRAVIRNPGRLLPEAEPYLFQRLHRGEASRTGRGNGLGLAIAQTIVRLHGGTLTLTNVGPDVVEARVVVPPASSNLHRIPPQNGLDSI